jgi:hypothetical protein
VSWVPKGWNDRERGGSRNSDQEAWDAADAKEAGGFRERGAVQSVSKAEASALGAKWMPIIVHREVKTEGTGTGADFQVKVKRKSRICIRGDKGKWGEDYFERTATTLRLEDAQLFFAAIVGGGGDGEVAPDSYDGGTLTSIDFNQAHLQCKRDPSLRPIYVEIPPCDPDCGKVAADGTPLVWLVIGGFYGQVPMPREWDNHLGGYMRARGAVRGSHSRAFYVFRSATGSGAEVKAIYHADDMMLHSDDHAAGDAELALLHEAGFACKKTGGYDAFGRFRALFVGFDVVHQRGGVAGHPFPWVHMSAETQIGHLVAAFGFDKAAPASTPFPAGYRYSAAPDEEKDVSAFAQCALVLVGALLYLGYARPDVFAQRAALQRKAASGWNARDVALAKTTLRYLKGSPTFGIRWTGGLPVGERNKLYIAADSDFNPGNTSLSVVPIINGGPVGATVTRAPKDVDSPNAGEVCALHQAARSAVTLRHALGEYGLHQPGPTAILEDNDAAIGQAGSGGGLKKARHLQGRVNLVSSLQERGVVVVKKVDGDKNPADMATKPAQKSGLHQTLRNMVMSAR